MVLSCDAVKQHSQYLQSILFAEMCGVDLVWAIVDKEVLHTYAGNIFDQNETNVSLMSFLLISRREVECPRAKERWSERSRLAGSLEALVGRGFYTVISVGITNSITRITANIRKRGIVQRIIYLCYCFKGCCTLSVGRDRAEKDLSTSSVSNGERLLNDEPGSVLLCWNRRFEQRMSEYILSLSHRIQPLISTEGIRCSGTGTTAAEWWRGNMC